jgi:hypothetical protein
MYTYDDYLKKKTEYGFGTDQISDADDRLAQMNPDAGMALLGYKNDWINATNDSQRAFAHAGAEDIRSRYGNYTGGESGGSFAPTGTTAYDDPWETAVQAQIKNMENREFEWSPETDPMVKYYEDAYRREGERAMKDTLGAVAATTGGIPSSYATAAAAQQNNYYMQQLTDKYPEIYKQAYDIFLSEFERDNEMLDVYSKQSDADYGRWLDKQELDRQARQDSAAANQQAFENQILKDELDLKIRELDASERQAAEELAYKYAALEASGKQADAELQYKYAALSQQAKEIVQEYAYKYASLDESKRQYDLSLEQQMIIAEMEDQLERDKITASKDAEELEMATVAAKYGDFSALKALGYDVSKYEEIWNKQMDEELNPEAADEGTEEDVINNMASQTGGENIMKRNEPSFYDLDSSMLDSLAADAPTYKAKADTEKAAQEQENRDNYGAKYAKYLNGETLSKDELKNLNDALERWIDAYRSGEDLTAEALAAVERYNNENVMKELFDRYRAGGQMLGVEEAMMKHFVEDAYNRQRAGQKVTPIEQGILDIWLGGRKVKVGKYW